MNGRLDTYTTSDLLDALRDASPHRLAPQPWSQWIITPQSRLAKFRRHPDADGMTLIRGTALAGYDELVSECGGDPSALLRAAGIPSEAVGEYGVFVDYVRLLRAVESAARTTATPDFGRRLALRQGIEILGAVGAAARSAPTVAQALATFERYLRAYSPAVAVSVVGLENPRYAFFEYRIVIDRLPPHAQSIELALGVTLRVFRLLLGPQYAPVSVHLPHEALTPRRQYVRYFGAAPRFRTSPDRVRVAASASPLGGAAPLETDPTSASPSVARWRAGWLSAVAAGSSPSRLRSRCRPARGSRRTPRPTAG